MGLIDDSGFERHGTTWRDLAAMLFGRRRIIIAIILGTILGTYATLALITERYESTATLLVKLGRENTEIPLTAQNTGFVATGLRKEGINSEIQILTSRSLVEETVDKLGADLFRSSLQTPESLLGYPRYIVKTCVRWSKKQGRSALIALNLKKKISEREAAIQLIAGALRVEPMKDSDVIAVSVRIADPALCVKVLDTILEFYLEHHVRAWRTPQARDFFAMQLEANQQTLEELGDLRETVRSKWNLVSVDEQRTMLLQQLADIDGQFELNEAEIADLRAQKASMLRRLEEIPERVSATEIQTQNPSIPSIKERLTSLELERAKIVTRYKPGAEPVKMVEAEIAQLERILATEEPTLLGSVSSETNPVRQTFLRSIEQMHIRILGLEERNRTLLEPIVDIREGNVVTKYLLLLVPVTLWMTPIQTIHAEEVEVPEFLRTTPTLSLHLFGEVRYYSETLAGETDYFAGQQAAHLVSQLSDRFTLFGEFSLTSNPGDTHGDVERLILRYDYSDLFKLSGGRYHTPVGYWNSTFHHGAWLETSIDRPRMMKFGSQVVPIHFEGFLLEGTFPVGNQNMGYRAGAGIGIHNNITVQDNHGDSEGEGAYSLQWYTRPQSIPGLELGLSWFQDTVDLNDGRHDATHGGESVETVPDVDNVIYGAHIAKEGDGLEFIAEYLIWDHEEDRAAGRSSSGTGYYALVAHRLGGRLQPVKPYARYDRVNADADDVLFAKPQGFESVTVGVRYDFSDFAAWKVEYRHEDPDGTDQDLDSFTMELSFVFPNLLNL